MVAGFSAAVSTAMYARSCTETDGGIDYTNFGVSKAYNGVFQDNCTGPASLLEYYCDNGFVRPVLHNCPEGCNNGECRAHNPNTITFTNTCTDSDGGRDYSVKGMLGNGNEDVCLSRVRLREWYCKGKTPKSVIYNCEYGCENGACRGSATTTTTTTLSPWIQTMAVSRVRTTSTTLGCVDSDGGEVFEVKGVVALDGFKQDDDCIGYKKLREWYCERNKPRSYVKICLDGCKDGACR